MTTYVAFLRAINVAGHAVVKMTDLRDAFAAAGCKDVRSLIQSGNVVFESPAKTTAALVRRIRVRLRGLLGEEPGLFLRTVREIERELIPYCRWAGVGILPYFPLAGGFLTGKYRRGEPPPPGSRGERSAYVQKYLADANFGILDPLRAFAQARGHTVGELAVAWLLAQPQVCSVISGATRPEQVTANAAAAGWTLTPEELAEVRGILEGKAD